MSLFKIFFFSAMILLVIVVVREFSIKTKKAVEQLNSLKEKVVIEKEKRSILLSQLEASLVQLESARKKSQELDIQIEKQTLELTGVKQQIQLANTKLDHLKEASNLKKENFLLTLQESADARVSLIENTYAKEEEKCISQITDINFSIKQKTEKLKKLEALQKEILQSQIRDQQRKESQDHFRLKISKQQISDIQMLEKVIPQLHSPKILKQLIWKNFFLPVAQSKFPLIIGEKTATGIYKITNLETEECYIGQSTDIYRRWLDHCKCGLGINTPATNKLYQAMLEYGLSNFSFEVLSKCSREELNEKERYYINYYSSRSFGYNSTTGNK